VLLVPSRAYSPAGGAQPLQKGQKEHFISHPSRASLWVQVERFVEGLQGRRRWYQRWWQGRRETLRSATHIFGGFGRVKSWDRRWEAFFAGKVGRVVVGSV